MSELLPSEPLVFRAVDSERLDVLIRIAKRGKKNAELLKQTFMLDLWVHMLDELERIKG